MISAASPISSYSSAIVILRGGAANVTDRAADNLSIRGLVDSIFDEFGVDENGGFWMPDFTVRSVALSGGGVAAYAGPQSTVIGTDRDDIILARGNSYVDGGAGNDLIYVSDGSVGFGSDGHDWVAATEGSVVSGGSGNDLMYASVGSIAFGDDGDDDIYVGAWSEGYAGAGNDVITVAGGYADGGTGNDTIVVRGFITDVRIANKIRGGEGNDQIDLTWTYGSTVFYQEGDGKDTLTLAAAPPIFGRPKDSFSINTLILEKGISEENATIVVDGNQAVISFGDTGSDKITVNFTESSTLRVAFEGGGTRDMTWTPDGGFRVTDTVSNSITAQYSEF